MRTTQRVRRVLQAVTLAAIVGGAVPAAAQPAPWLPERLTPGWTFTPSIVFGGMWDSNATVRSEGNPTVEEWVGLVNPRGEVDFNGRRTRFNIGYSGSLEAYRNLDELTRYDQRGRLEVRHQMTPRLQLVSRHSLALVPTTDQLELNGLPFERVGSRLFDARGGFIFAMSPRTTLAGDYTFQWVRFEREGARFAFLRGGHSHSPSLRLTHRLSSRASVGGAYDYRHANIGGGEETVDIQHALAEAAYELTRTTTITGGAGLAHLRLATTGEARTGPSFRAGLSQQAQQVTIGVGYERSFVPSYGFGGTTVNEVFTASARVPFARGRLFWTGGVAYRRSEPLTVRGLDVELDSFWTQSAVGYYVARWLRMEAFYAGTHQTSSARGQVDRTRIGVQFVTSKPVRIQ